MNNNVCFTGYVGNEPTEIKMIESSKKLVKFSLAVKQFRAKGEDDTMWLDIEAWETIAPKVLATVSKGREIVVNGRLALSEYVDKEGTKVVRPVVKLGGFYLCGKRPASYNGTAPAKQTQDDEAA